MTWSVRVGRVGGTELRIHLTFLLLLTWIAIGYYAGGGLDAAIWGVAFILLVFGCVLLHEFGHVLAARRYGIHTPSITLYPIGGVARLARMPEEPRQELVVALAGPAVNVIIAALLVLAGQDLDLGRLFSIDRDNASIASKLLDTNVFLLLFNMLPAFPMDGGRVLRAVLAMRMSHVRATQVAASVGQGFAFIFGFLGLFSNPLLVFIALFVYLGAAQESAVAQMRNVTTRLPLAAAMVTEFKTLAPESSTADAVELLLSTSQHEFPVVDAEGRLSGLVTRDGLIAAVGRNERDPVSAFMHSDIPVLPWTTSLDEAFALITERRCPALAIAHDDGRLAGLITTDNLQEMLLIQNARAGRRVA